MRICLRVLETRLSHYEDCVICGMPTATMAQAFTFKVFKNLHPRAKSLRKQMLIIRPLLITIKDRTLYLTLYLRHYEIF